MRDHQEHQNLDPWAHCQQRQSSRSCWRGSPPMQFLCDYIEWDMRARYYIYIYMRREKQNLSQYLYPAFNLWNVVCYGNHRDPIQQENKPIQTKVSPSAVCPPPPFFFSSNAAMCQGTSEPFKKRLLWPAVFRVKLLCNRLWGFTTGWFKIY